MVKAAPGAIIDNLTDAAKAVNWQWVNCEDLVWFIHDQDQKISQGIPGCNAIYRSLVKQPVPEEFPRYGKQISERTERDTKKSMAKIRASWNRQCQKGANTKDGLRSVKDLIWCSHNFRIERIEKVSWSCPLLSKTKKDTLQSPCLVPVTLSRAFTR